LLKVLSLLARDWSVVRPSDKTLEEAHGRDSEMNGESDDGLHPADADRDTVNAFRGLRIATRVHVDAPTTLPTLCKFYARGNCANGRACRFYHPPDPTAQGAEPQQETHPPLARPSAASFVSRASTHGSHHQRGQYVDFNSAYAAVFVPQKQTTSEAGDPAGAVDETPRFVTGLADERERSYAGAAARAVGADLSCSGYEKDASYVPRQQHWENTAGKLPELSTVLCRYHADGNCRYGQDCIYVHGSFCSLCLKNVLHPTDNAIAAKHVEQCSADAERRARLAENANMECGSYTKRLLLMAHNFDLWQPTISHLTLDEILNNFLPRFAFVCLFGLESGICYENPAAHTRKFGLLQNCEHIFCLKCIREWRGMESAESFGREAVRTCPLCRVESHMVIPSDTFESDPDAKLRLHEAYKGKLCLIPCKHFAFGEGTCPFGTSCLYSHVDRDGNEPDKDSALLFSDTGSKLKTGHTLLDYL
jgi:E3 ubiquitin-protein ligase makorin